MKTLAEILVEMLVEDEFAIDVICDGEIDVEASTDYDEIIDAVNAVSCFSNIVAYKNNRYFGQFMVSLDDSFEPEETIIDHVENYFCNAYYAKAMIALDSMVGH